MPAFDFREIALPTSGASRDQFELFARDLLDSLGFRIVVGPDRGPDAGRDLVVEELRTGIAGETKVKWLVSCKHHAHSGTSVTPDDERDIHDRIRTHTCAGFIGFYSTLPSSGLAAKLHAPGLTFEVQIFDSEKVEKTLLASPNGHVISKRYLPISWAKWKQEHPHPAKLFKEEPSLVCLYCGKNLLDGKPSGIIVVWSTTSSAEVQRTEQVYWCCKGACDKALGQKHKAPGLVDRWEDIPDLTAPLAYVRWVSGILNDYGRGEIYSPSAIESTRTFLLNLFPLVSREMTDEENNRIRELSAIPAYLGGWGYDD